MPYHPIQVQQLTPLAGAEIHGVDLAQPLDERSVKEIHDALIAHGG